MTTATSEPRMTAGATAGPAAGLTDHERAGRVDAAIREACRLANWPAHAVCTVTRAEEVLGAVIRVMGDGVGRTLQSRWTDGRPVNGRVRTVAVIRAGTRATGFELVATAEKW